MLKPRIQEAINDQIQSEFHSAYLYLSMSAWFEEKNLGGFGHWMRLQAQEEVGHAMKLFEYVIERGGRAILQAIDKPRADFDSPLEVFEEALGHERKVSDMINELMTLAVEERDYATQAQLQWFVTEQVEEEASAEAIVERVRLADGQPAALLILDRELGARTATD